MAAGGGAGCIPSGSLAGLLVTGLVITGAIGLWSATATATARHLTLARAGTLSVPVGDAAAGCFVAHATACSGWPCAARRPAGVNALRRHDVRLLVTPSRTEECCRAGSGDEGAVGLGRPICAVRVRKSTPLGS